MESFSVFPAQKSRTAFALDEILQVLKSGKHHVGDRLPSERVLAGQLAVGRAAVREALSALQVMGIVERRVGDGTYLCGGMESLMGVEPALAAIRENQSLGEVWQARKILEIVLAELAVHKASESDLFALRESLSWITEAIAERNYDDYADADRDFHLSLAKAAKNPFLQQAHSPILAITHQQLATQVDSCYIAQHGDKMVEGHRAILVGLETRDKKNIRSVVNDHFIASERLFLGLHNNGQTEV